MFKSLQESCTIELLLFLFTSEKTDRQHQGGRILTVQGAQGRSVSQVIQNPSEWNHQTIASWKNSQIQPQCFLSFLLPISHTREVPQDLSSNMMMLVLGFGDQVPDLSVSVLMVKYDPSGSVPRFPGEPSS